MRDCMLFNKFVEVCTNIFDNELDFSLLLSSGDFIVYITKYNIKHIHKC